MVTTVGEFEFEVAEMGAFTSARDWHFPLPRIHWRPKVKSVRDQPLFTRYAHKGSHRKADPLRTSQRITVRLFTIALAIYHYYVVALIMKGAAAASDLLVLANFALAAAIGAGAVTVYFLRKAKTPVITAADIVYVTSEEARGGYGDGDTFEYKTNGGDPA